jgi:hypothetical protein
MPRRDVLDTNVQLAPRSGPLGDLLQPVDAYSAAHNVTRATAIRMLIKRGLAANIDATPVGPRPRREK